MNRTHIEKSIVLLLCIFLASCSSSEKHPAFIERYQPSLDEIISVTVKRDTITTGYDWSEGPVWVASENMLLFSDVPKNIIYTWTEKDGAKPYLTPSGYTDTIPRGGEPGSNGLIINKAGELILSQHGDRKIAAMQSSLSDPKPVFRTLADNYNGKKLNSPNDIIQDSQGNYYFTDPPYGMVNPERDSTKETPFQGVYKITTDGKIHLLLDSLTRPNGIALSPDEKFLYIANSDPEKAYVYKYEVDGDRVKSGKVMYDASALTKSLPGLPDGMKIDAKGNVFATGPGGIFIFSPADELIGKILFNDPTSNCAFADDGKTLYATSDMHIFRIELRK